MGDKPQDGFLITGHIEKPEKGKFLVLYKVTPTDKVLVDSVEADADGDFQFVGKVPELQMFMLMIYGGQVEFFVAGNEDVKLDIKGALPNAKIEVKAGKEQETLVPIMALFRKQAEEFRPMQYEYQLAIENRDMARAERYRGMLEQGVAFYKRRYKFLIDSLGPSFGAYTAATRLSLDEDFGAIDSLAQKLVAKYKGQKWVETFAQEVQVAKKLAIGQPAPVFTAATPDGAQVGPANFKGKYLILDFWASWCKPCRMNSPAMVALYKKYKSQGVEILGVSLDKSKEPWVAAIKKDGYTWPQVSDLKYWDCEPAKAYKVEGIPNLVLLDQEGRIVARGLDPTSADALLAQRLGAAAPIN
jgi:peroxiredoxin